jgi:hypothetical protein
MNSRLILCVEEQDNENIYNKIDTRLFIGWDYLTKVFFVRGRRQDAKNSDFVPYSFSFKSVVDVYNFVEFVMGKKATTNIIMYNYNNTASLYDEDLTYEFFQEHLDKNYEIAGYDGIKLNGVDFTGLTLLLSKQVQVNQK